MSDKTLNKKEFVAALAQDCGLTQTVCAKVLDSLHSTIGAALKKGQTIRMIGFGSFYTAKRLATNGRNPRTGAVIKIPASTQPKFKAGKGLKDMVNSK